jgi:outer membrane protein TolC
MRRSNAASISLRAKFADGLDRLALRADRDLALAFARDINRLIDLGRAVFALFPGIGLDVSSYGSSSCRRRNAFSRVISAASTRAGASMV